MNITIARFKGIKMNNIHWADGWTKTNATQMENFDKYWEQAINALHATKIQKWYRYWKPFQDFKINYPDEFKLLIQVFRCSKLSFSQKYNYVTELKRMWNDFNKYIPNDSHCHGQEGNRVYLEYLFDHRKDIVQMLKYDKDHYLTLHTTGGAWHPEIIPLRRDLSYFTRLQNGALNNLYCMLSDDNQCRMNIPIPWHQPLMPGKTQDCMSKCHTIDDFPIKNAREIVENIIHIFENTHFPYLLYRFMKYDNQNIVYRHYESHHNTSWVW